MEHPFMLFDSSINSIICKIVEYPFLMSNGTMNANILKEENMLYTPFPVTRNIKSGCPWKVSMQRV